MATPHLCRDCRAAWSSAAPAPQCPRCGSPRVARHRELNQLAVAHLDCDAFYAAIEQRDDAALAGVPLIIGGGRRGVVATCSYEARPFGVHSAMPMFKALELCPQAVVMRPNMEKYRAEARRLRALMRELTPIVEPVSIDEAFLDLAGTEDLHGCSPAASLAGLAGRIEADLRITVSIGLSYNKFLAKIASELDKPRGFSMIGRAEAMTFLDSKPVRLISGVGPALERRLAAEDVHTIGDLQRFPEAELAGRYGKVGARLARLARGEDSRKVEPDSERKSLSSEITLEHDVADPDDLKRALWRQCEKVARGLKKEGLAGRTITLKLKSSDFKLRTRSISLANATQLADVIYRTAAPLLTREADGTRFRLVGIGVAGFSPLGDADPLDLFAIGSGRSTGVERAMDEVVRRFGPGAIVRGRGAG